MALNGLWRPSFFSSTMDSAARLCAKALWDGVLTLRRNHSEQFGGAQLELSGKPTWPSLCLPLVLLADHVYRL